MPEDSGNPLERIYAAQQMAMQTFSSAVRTLTDTAKRGLPESDPTTERLFAMVEALNSLATMSAVPLGEFLDGQRRLADSMATLARLQAEMSKVLETTAKNHDAVVSALEVLLGPLVKKSTESDEAAE